MHEMINWILKEEVKTTFQISDEIKTTFKISDEIKTIWNMTGVTLLSDNWSDMRWCIRLEMILEDKGRAKPNLPQVDVLHEHPKKINLCLM